MDLVISSYPQVNYLSLDVGGVYFLVNSELKSDMVPTTTIDFSVNLPTRCNRVRHHFNH